mmetsp:Transcript_41131/g.57237  ORF Transcript_41131/g.57237 Transcript_41131/m.57237 type:complete len:151 (+) Transcript_41131:129-581(+)|eukprot:CAMPEP_0201487402 /NCGR_PEP_ID=MMETSP0151_2-20130828/12842_1 /ASSEMBLY_ACC=CAM_ASM_000257 /TAXON_ID=200890 /ORGANISM="Paramoeba atlantica, Strain 621/1 / CCAP 1560/9" /LENGTH=150 /DNA_ID=CAMNT_0047872421 /DNA_START=106 /DNA_END=558 /DNA_ORIENTATION=+
MSVVIPRNFRLLEEYDAAIGKEGKSFVTGKHAGYIHYGLDEERQDNMNLHYWRATMIGPQQTNLGEFMYEIEVFVPDNYPETPPQVRFKAPKINMPAVNGSGHVDLSKLTPNFTWRTNYNIADVLKAIRENISQNSVIKSSSGLQGTQYF